MRRKTVLTKWLIFVGVLLTPLRASAQNLSLDPAEVQFGNVQVGQSVTQIVTIMSTEDYDLQIEDIMIWDDSTGSFQITSELPTFPYVMAQNEILDIEFTFTPTIEADLEGSFLIVSNAEPPNSFVEVWMYGTGVASDPPTPLSVADILAFFDASVANGKLVGKGWGNSADSRLKALRNMIEAAGDLIEAGEIEQACGQLRDAAYRCDAQSRPPDFVAGDAAATVNGMILSLFEQLGCG